MPTKTRVAPNKAAMLIFPIMIFDLSDCRAEARGRRARGGGGVGLVHRRE